MDVTNSEFSDHSQGELLDNQDQMDLRRGPWTVEEDLALINYIANHGEGRWNSLARCAGLRRTGKSCRLRWLNYLRPDVRRGNITLEEQLLILELHSRWGNRWSKIAQHLPGRTDNEIKNYWRTRVQKHAKQLQCDVNSKQFKDAMKYLWMPRLLERIRASSMNQNNNDSGAIAHANNNNNNNNNNHNMNNYSSSLGVQNNYHSAFTTPDNSSTTATSSDSLSAQDYYNTFHAHDDNNNNNNNNNKNNNDVVLQSAQTGHMSYHQECLTTPSSYFSDQGLMEIDQHQNNSNSYNVNNTSNMWLGGDEDTSENLWNVEDYMWFHQQQQHISNSNGF
ncbi:hypothetical protein Scep_008815 [Stephania cephalantha]|uniref:Uncharacterized protein n=1 Tax=Stephania cephalantha TaxID=152367 RepID=A0AAP0PDL0_9MAGN